MSMLGRSFHMIAKSVYVLYVIVSILQIVSSQDCN